MSVVLISKSYDSLVQLVARIRESHRVGSRGGVNSFRITVIIVVYIVSQVH